MVTRRAECSCGNVVCAYVVAGKPDIAQECLELAFLQMPRARR